MSDWRVKAASYGDVNRLANRMRDIDRREAAAFGHSPKRALVNGLRASTLCWTVTLDGEPVAMFGVAPVSILNRTGAPWMLGTYAISRSHRAILKLAPPLLRAMLDDYPRLENLISVDNVTSIAWLDRLGFAFDDDVRYVGGEAFRRFHMGF